MQRGIWLFHTIALAAVDTDFAKEQLSLMLNEFYLHPTGQIPAYEWNFSDAIDRCTPGPPFSYTAPNRLCMAKATSNSWSAHFLS